MASVQHRGGFWQLSATQHEWRCSDTEVDKGNVNVSASGQRTNCNAKSKVSQEALCLVKSQLCSAPVARVLPISAG